MSDARVLVIVPARGGSKGIRHKNLALVGGIPLVGRACRTGRLAVEQLGAPARVICSTDDDHIADAARRWGAEVPFLRPAELATDSASTIDVVLHLLTTLNDRHSTVVLLQATSPMTSVADVVESVRLHWVTGRQVVSVTSSEHPPEWSCRLASDQTLIPHGPSVPHQRQAGDRSYRLNGAVYVSSASQLASFQSFMGDGAQAFVMPAERSIDVDSPHDLDVADAIAHRRTPRAFSVRGRGIGPGHPCFVIAEAGVNHNGRIDDALRLVDVAVAAGADACKFQTFKASRLASPQAAKAPYQARSGATESQLAMLTRLELSESAHVRLVDHCRDAGILFLSTPFDQGSADLLDGLDMPLFKLPSGELTNLEFIHHVAAKGKPVILSTGMGDLVEVADAVDRIRTAGGRDLALLHCVSSYPTPLEATNLSAMLTLQAAFEAPVGFSDHTEGQDAAGLAVAMGAHVIEKHFTLDRSLPGPDQHVSLEPLELAELVRHIRTVEAAIGHGRKEMSAVEATTAVAARRSLVAACHIEAGEALGSHMVTALRPGTGLAPRQLFSIVGRTALVRIEAGTILRRDMFS